MNYKILRLEQWKELYKDKPHFHHTLRMFENVQTCKVEMFTGSVIGNLNIPNKEDVFEKEHRVSFLLTEGTLILIDDTFYAEHIVRKALKVMEEDDGVVELCQRFLVEILEEDMSYLEKMEEELSQLEEDVLEDNIETYNHRMSKFRKELMRLYTYYEQLSMMGETLQERYMSNGKQARMFDAFEHRADRLQGRTQMLREYTKQVQEVYQAQVGAKQNEIMKLLTIVATVFMPLTLITGWYGMNFNNMPELTWKYGYIVVILFSIFIIGVCTWISKKKFMK